MRLTEEVDGVLAVAEPAGGLAPREVDAVVREVRPEDGRQVVVVPDVREGVAQHVDRRHGRRRGRRRQERSCRHQGNDSHGPRRGGGGHGSSAHCSRALSLTAHNGVDHGR